MITMYDVAAHLLTIDRSEIHRVHYTSDLHMTGELSDGHPFFFPADSVDIVCHELFRAAFPAGQATAD